MATLVAPFIPNQPVSPRNANGIAHSTPKADRAAVKAAWATWVADWKSYNVDSVGSDPGLFDYVGFDYADETLGPAFDLGTTVSWTDNTYFDNYTQQSGVTTTDGTDTNNLCWQLYYAHQPLTIPADGVNRLGIVTYRSGSNTVNWRYAISTVDDTLGSFAADAQFANQSFSYTAGGFNEQAADAAVTIPANRYFLIGAVAGPFYRATKLLANNRTAYIGATPYVTVFNTFYQSGWPSGPTTGIPTQLGGSATFTEFTDRVSVASVKFKV